MSKRNRRGERRFRPPAHQPIDSLPPLAGPTIGVPGFVVHTVSASYSGPIPPPQFLREYNEIIPGGARATSCNGREANLPIAGQSKAMNHGIVRSWGGLIAGFIIAMTALGGGIYLVLQGHDTGWGYHRNSRSRFSCKRFRNRH